MTPVFTRATILTVAAFAVLRVGGTARAAEHTLDELVEEALRTSATIKIVESELAKTEEQIWEAKGNAFPEIGASINYQYAWETVNPYADMDMSMPEESTATLINMMYQGMLAAQGMAPPYPPAPLDAGDSLLAMYFDGVFGALGGAFDLEMPPHALAMSLSLTQPLFAQGKVSIGLRIAKKYKETLLCKYDASRQQVVTDVTKLFYGALLARKNVEIQNEAVELANEVHRLAVMRHSLGKGTEIDTLASRLRLEQALMASRDAEGQQRTASEALIKAAGLPEDVDEFSVSGEFPSDDYRISLDEALTDLHENSKIIGQLKGGEVVQEELVKLQKSDFYPMVYCGASVGKILMFDGFDDIDWSREGQNDGSVFVGANYTLFNGMKRLRKIRQAKEDVRAFRLTREHTTDMLELGVRNAWERLETSREQLNSSRALVTLAEKAYSLSKRAYEVGSMTLSDLQQRQLDLNGAKLALNASQFAFESAALDLQLLIGGVPLN